MRVLGFMSGTSLDAVDSAVVETDGVQILRLGPAGEMKLPEAVRTKVEAAIAAARTWPRGAPAPAAFAEAADAVADAHIEAARDMLAANNLATGDLDLIGFHGQTVLHERPGPDGPGRTVQLGDAGRIADALGLPVAFDFRSADVAAGGEGAPLAPVYHAALARWSGLPPGAAVLNLGGVGNITLIGSDGALRAFDTGPANGMIDLWVQTHGAGRFDPDGRLAAAGRVDEARLEAYLAHPYFGAEGPKSLDRYDFSLDSLSGLGLEDGAATLTAFAAEAAAIAIRRASPKPGVVIACGGGRRNPALVSEIARRSGVRVEPAESMGWRGDSIEAEAFAFLAARTRAGLPISFPGTTGAPRPMTGGRIAEPGGAR